MWSESHFVRYVELEEDSTLDSDLVGWCLFLDCLLRSFLNRLFLLLSVKLHLFHLLSHLEPLHVHLKPLLLHVKSLLIHIKLLLLHVKSLLIHIKLLLLHIKIILLHIKTLLIRCTSGWQLLLLCIGAWLVDDYSAGL